MFPVLSEPAGIVGDATTGGTLVVVPGGGKFVLGVVSTGGLSTAAGSGKLVSSAEAAVSKPEAEYSKGASKDVLKDRFALEADGDAAARSSVRDSCTDEKGLGVSKLCTA